jgi:hemoglobin/transferrin/lactoferrin receptor protein
MTPNSLRSALSRTMLTGLLASVAATGFVAPAFAQSAPARGVVIPAQALDSALHTLMDATGTQITYESALSAGKRSSAIDGRMSAIAALSRLLAGTGLTYRQTGPRSFTLEALPAAEAGVTRIGTLRVQGAGSGGGNGRGDGAGWDGSAETVFTTPGSVSHISRETIDRFPGTSPADILKSVPGVLSGEARNSGGVDVNIRGLQGQGRVAVTVDGTINGTTVYRGYQGIGNRSYIDKDFIGSVSIDKGPSTGPGGAGAIGGTVSMTTIGADDIIPDGEALAVRMKLSVGNNATERAAIGKGTLLTGSNSRTRDIARPDFLSPGSSAGSVVFASKGSWLDLVAGFSYRRAGNYHAGNEGPGVAGPGSPPAFCITRPTNSTCTSALEWYAGPGQTAFLGGEEVLNTSEDTKSGLIKATIRIGNDHAVELGYSKYVSRFGENYPASVYRNTDGVNQARLSTTELDRYSLRYAWNPDNDLIAVKWNVWGTNLEESSQALGGIGSLPKFVEMRGTDVANTARFDTGMGELIAEFGGSYLFEKTGPVAGVWQGIPGRQGDRRETSAFARANWSPTDWLQLDGGLRYQHYKVHDELALATDPKRSAEAVGFSAGVTVEPLDGLQVFATYKDAARMPALLESTRGFFMSSDPALKPERAKNWELGANFTRRGAVFGDDEVNLKLVRFDNDIADYISRQWNTTTYVMYIFNTDRAKFAGFEASGSYKIGDFSAAFSATRYTDVSFCRINQPCANSSLAADYATNHVPPEFSANLTLTQSFFNDRLTISGRLNHVGERAAKAEVPASGASPFIAAIPWEPYTTGDVFVGVKISKALSIDASIENLTDHYYVEPLNLGLLPAPGRTFRIGLTGLLAPRSGGEGALSSLWSGTPARGADDYDWSGPYAGIHAGYANRAAYTDQLTLARGGALNENMPYELGSDDGGVVGVQAGYNLQLNRLFVIGAEIEYQRGGASLTERTNTTDTMTLDYDAMGTVRVRAGVTQGRWLGYATAGWAKAELERSWTRSAVLFADKGGAEGYTVGGGIEYGVSRALSIKGEYGLTDLRSGLRETSVTANGSQWDYRSESHLRISQLKLGANFRF